MPCPYDGMPGYAVLLLSTREAAPICIAAAQVVSLLIAVAALAILVYRHRFRPRRAQPIAATTETVSDLPESE